jgi:hypothetical protein
LYLSSRISPERCAVLVAVVAAHLLALALLSKIRSNRSGTIEWNVQKLEALQLLDLPQAPIPGAPKSQPDLFHKKHTRSQHGVDIPGGPSPAGIAEPPPEKPSIDWNLEAERAASATIDQMVQHGEIKCDDSVDSNQRAILVLKCKKHTPGFAWDPEPKKAGFIGIVPYVRLGKHCLVGLGFFGCAIGKLPEANGHLFDHMRDPDRDRSSVPDINE